MLLFTGTSVPFSLRANAERDSSYVYKMKGERNESQIFGKTDVREVQGNQEKRLYSYYLL